MRTMLIPSHKLSGPMHENLRERLDQFYGAGTSYTAFQNPSDQRNCWEQMVVGIKEKLQNNPVQRLKILEIGAGKTGFARYLKEQKLREAVEFHVQDVTAYNKDWLHGEADKVFFGDILNIVFPGKYDLVFSTYVLEHVTNPFAHLEKIWTLVEPHGDLFVFSPRYDFPGYLCPSSRHLEIWKRLQFAFQMSWARFSTIVFGRPQFLVQTDLAAFHQPFYLDSDAVHWVSLFDLKTWARRHQTSVKTLHIGNPVFPSKDWVIKRLCTTALQIHKKR